MGKVFVPPSTIQKPDSIETEATYVAAVKEFAKATGKGKLAGEEISFQVGEGYARYIVYSTSPVVLLHLAVGGAYQYQYATRLVASDIKREVERGQNSTKYSQAIADLFAKNGAVDVQINHADRGEVEMFQKELRGEF